MTHKNNITIEVPTKIRPACEMSVRELSRWFALMNMLKFINQGELICKTKKSEEEIHQRCMEKYIETVSGDLERSLKDHNGIPFKYSLNPNDEDSTIIEEIPYV
jgi:hypothetical protein